MEEQKPLEQPEMQKSKAELFAEAPDKFVNTDDLIIALKRTPQGPAMFCRPVSRPEAIMAKAECDIVLTSLILRQDVKSEQAKSKIVKPQGSILDFARRRNK